MSNIKLILETNCCPKVDLYINDVKKSTVDRWPCDKFGNTILEFEHDLLTNNLIVLEVTQINGYLKINDIIVDDIKFGLVTFMCTTINREQQTQINSSGLIEVKICAPIWKFWCDMMNNFNYEDYPLGSIN